MIHFKGTEMELRDLLIERVAEKMDEGFWNAAGVVAGSAGRILKKAGKTVARRTLDAGLQVLGATNPIIRDKVANPARIAAGTAKKNKKGQMEIV